MERGEREDEGTPAWGTPERGAPGDGVPAWGTPPQGWVAPGSWVPDGKADFGCIGCLIVLVASFFWLFGSIPAVNADDVVGRWLGVRWSVTTDPAAQAEAGWPGYDTVDVATGTRLYLEGADPSLTCRVSAVDEGWTAFVPQPGRARAAEFTAATSPVRIRCDDSAGWSPVHVWRDDAGDVRRFHQLAPVAAFGWVFAVGALICGALRLLIWWMLRTRPL